MTKLLNYVRANAIAFLALFVALGGAGYAAVRVPRNSVGAPQLKNHSIDPVKFDPKTIGGNVRAWAYVSATGHVYASRGVGSHVFVQTDSPGSYGLTLENQRVRSCAVTAAPAGDAHGASAPGSALANLSVFPHMPTALAVGTFNAAGQPSPLPFVVQVLC